MVHTPGVLYPPYFIAPTSKLAGSGQKTLIQDHSTLRGILMMSDLSILLQAPLNHGTVLGEDALFILSQDLVCFSGICVLTHGKCAVGKEHIHRFD